MEQKAALRIIRPLSAFKNLWTVDVANLLFGQQPQPMTQQSSPLASFSILAIRGTTRYVRKVPLWFSMKRLRALIKGYLELQFFPSLLKHRNYAEYIFLFIKLFEECLGRTASFLEVAGEGH